MQGGNFGQCSPGSSPTGEGCESPRLSFASDTESISNPGDALRSVFHQLLFMRASVAPSSSSLASSSLASPAASSLRIHNRSASAYPIVSPTASPLIPATSVPPPLATSPTSLPQTLSSSGGATSSDVIVMIDSLLGQLEPFVVGSLSPGSDSPISSLPSPPLRVEFTIDPPQTATPSQRPSSALPPTRARRESQPVPRRRGSRHQSSHTSKNLPIPDVSPHDQAFTHASASRHLSQVPPSSLSRRSQSQGRLPRGSGGGGGGASNGIGRLMKRRRLGPVTRSMSRRMEEEKFRADFVQQMVRSLNPKEREAIDWVEMMFLGQPEARGALVDRRQSSPQLSETASTLQRSLEAVATRNGTAPIDHRDDNHAKLIVPARAVVSAYRFGKKLMQSTTARIARALSMPSVTAILEKLGTWEFDVLALQQHTDKPLSLVMKKVFDDLHFGDTLQIKPDKFFAFVDAIEEMYQDVPYHNRFHATDVVANMYFWSRSPTFRRYIASDLDLFVALIAAAVHDVGHPGTSNEFQVNTRSKWAVLYNDQSVLENMHCSTAIQLMSEEKYNFCEDMCAQDVKQVRETIIAMVLATDMHKHRENVQDLQALIDRLRDEKCNGGGGASSKRKSDAPNKSCKSDPDKKRGELSRADRFILLKSGLHTADVAVPTKRRPITLKWTNMLFEEFYDQGDIERENNLPISPSMDRAKPNVEVAQLKFCEWIIQPLFSRWRQIIPEGDVCLTGLKRNVQRWETDAKQRHLSPTAEHQNGDNTDSDTRPSASVPASTSTQSSPTVVEVAATTSSTRSNGSSSPVVNMDTSESHLVPPRILSCRGQRHKIHVLPPTPTVDVSPSPHRRRKVDEECDEDCDAVMSDADTSSRSLQRRRQHRADADSMSDDDAPPSHGLEPPTSASSPSAPSPSPKSRDPQLEKQPRSFPWTCSANLRNEFESEHKEESSVPPDGAGGHTSPFSSPDVGSTGQRRQRLRKGRKRSRSPMSDGGTPSAPLIFTPRVKNDSPTQNSHTHTHEHPSPSSAHTHTKHCRIISRSTEASSRPHSAHTRSMGRLGDSATRADMSSPTKRSRTGARSPVSAVS